MRIANICILFSSLQQIPENHWLYRLKADIQKIEPSTQLILYSSRARGNYKPDSDWDLLLLTDKPRLSFEETMKIRTPISLAKLDLEQVISLQVFNRQKWENRVYISPFFEKKEKDSILI